MQPVRPLLCALLLVLSALLAGCGDPVETVRGARIPPDLSVTVAEALERYPYFTKVTWRTYVDDAGKRVVEAECDIDVAATCREVNEAGLALATRDVRRDYLVAPFIVEGFPRKPRPQEAYHVTVCTNGSRLTFADPKYLRAIYGRERVRFFCLEGLNCPGATAQ